MSLSKLRGGVLRVANDAIHVTAKSIPLEDPISGYVQSQSAQSLRYGGEPDTAEATLPAMDARSDVTRGNSAQHRAGMRTRPGRR